MLSTLERAVLRAEGRAEAERAEASEEEGAPMPLALKVVQGESAKTTTRPKPSNLDWGAETLTDGQIAYAASDVLYLHRLREVLDSRLEREGRSDLAQRCFDFLPTRARLDIEGWPEIDIFAH